MKKGFSLADMMIMMLLVAIVTAAMAPLVTRRMIRLSGASIWRRYEKSAGEAKYYAQWTPTKHDILIMDTEHGRIGITNTDGTYISGLGTPVNIDAKVLPESTIVFGRNNIIPNTNTDTISIGFDTKVYDNATKSYVIGSNSSARGENSIALGSSSIAGYRLSDVESEGNHSLAIGPSAQSTDDSIGLGYYAATRGINSMAIGSDTYSKDYGAMAFGTKAFSNTYGVQSESYSMESIAFGQQTRAVTESNHSALAIGKCATADASDGKDSSIRSNVWTGILHPIDEKLLQYGCWLTPSYTSGSNKATGTTIAIGNRAEALGTDAIALGGFTEAYGKRSIAIGTGSSNVGGNQSGIRATGEDSIAIGTDAKATGDNAVAIGKDASAADNTVQMGGPSQTVVNASDRRLKNVGKKFSAGLKELRKLTFYNYTYKKDKNQTPRVGVIAQDLKKVFPHAVFANKKGILSIRTEDMFYATINAVKELDARLTALATKVESIVYSSLQRKIKTQQAQIDAQRKTIVALDARVKRLERQYK